MYSERSKTLSEANVTRTYIIASILTATIPLLAWQQPPHAPLKLQVYEVNLAGVSRPVRDLPPKNPPPGRAIGTLFRLTQGGSSRNVADVATQGAASNTAPISTANDFEGISAASTNPTYSPPDENLAVGPAHIVQAVNMAFAVFNKSTGIMQPGFPKSIGTLYAGTGGACETQSQSDPIVRYDRQADRWFMSYVTFQVSVFLIVDSHICLAVSKTSDPAGAYYLYDADFGPRLHDYQKFGVWTDGWYMSANSFLYGLTLEGTDMCAWQRDKFLVGDTTGKVICVVTGDSSFSGLLPSDWDGNLAPPSGSPNYFLGLYSTAQLVVFKMHPNYANPAASQVTGPVYIDVSPFNLPCGGGACIPQANSTQLLDSLGDRVMYRLAYRNFGGHESLVVNHSVGTNNTVGIRWYEIRSPNGTPVVYQQSTYAPDSDFRWMASMAMDQSGNIALGYSKSSAVMNPGIFYTGREAGDALNSLRAEQAILTGSGSQLPGDGGSNRWGDYSALQTDPVDDCTFWYTSEYLTADGTFNWRTRLTSFKFSSCGGAPPKTDTSTTIASQTPNPSVTGQAYSVSVSVSPSGGSGTPTGTVTVGDGAGAACIVTLSGGSGSCSLTANTAVNRTLTAAYGGDSFFNGSTSASATHTVNKAGTTTTITDDSPDPSVVGQSYTVKFVVAVTPPGVGTPTGTVSIGDGAGGGCSGTLSGGGGSCVLTPGTAGVRTLTATYNGDLLVNGSVSVGVTHTVNAAATTTTINSDTPDPSIVGTAYTVSFTVAVTAPGAGVLSGSVTVSDGTGGACTATVAAGSCAITSTTTGTKTLTASYAGNANFSASSGTASHTVNPASVTPPAAPTNLTATPVYGTQGKKTVLQRITVSWTDNANNEDNFVLERWNITGKGPSRACTLGTTITVPAGSGMGPLSYSDTGASTSTCKYRVAARNSAATSTFVEIGVSP